MHHFKMANMAKTRLPFLDKAHIFTLEMHLQLSLVKGCVTLWYGDIVFRFEVNLKYLQSLGINIRFPRLE